MLLLPLLLAAEDFFEPFFAAKATTDRGAATERLAAMEAARRDRMAEAAAGATAARATIAERIVGRESVGKTHEGLLLKGESAEL